MADFWEKLWHGLRGELLRTILLAVTVSILLYTGLQPVSRVVLQSFYTNSDFLQTKTDAVGTLIQQNVAESGISSRQVRRITDWYSRGDQPGGCILRVEKDGVVIYDSALNNVEYYRTYSQASKTLDESAYLRTYPLEFSDGSATLYAYGYFDFAVDEAVRTAEFWLCLVLGIGIVLWAAHHGRGQKIRPGGLFRPRARGGRRRAGPDGPEPERDERLAQTADGAGAAGPAATV